MYRPPPAPLWVKENNGQPFSPQTPVDFLPEHNADSAVHGSSSFPNSSHQPAHGDHFFRSVPHQVWPDDPTRNGSSSLAPVEKGKDRSTYQTDTENLTAIPAKPSQRTDANVKLTVGHQKAQKTKRADLSTNDPPLEDMDVIAHDVLDRTSFIRIPNIELLHHEESDLLPRRNKQASGDSLEESDGIFLREPNANSC